MLKRKPQSLRSSKGENELAPKKDIEIKDIQQETETNNVVVEFLGQNMSVQKLRG
jgi:hypothetical protein